MKLRSQESKKLRMRDFGFTLLELLVVIGIIAILVSVATVSYSAAQKRTRDARRRTDIKGIQAAMEQSYSASGTFVYPACDAEVAITNANCAISGYFGSGNVPTDPGSTFYSFTTSSTTAYEVCATLEVGDPFCLSNLQ